MDPSTAAIAGVTPSVLLAVDQVVEVSGSGSKPWRIKRCKGGYYTCSCYSFADATKACPINARTCSHLKKLLGAAYEEARLKLAAAERKGSPVASMGTKRKREKDNDYLDYLETNSNAESSKTAAARTPTVSGLRASNLPDGLEEDPFSGRTTFNGRALRKDFDPDTAVPIMLSQTWDIDTMNPTGWWMSEKLDGVRAYWTGHRLISRTNIDWKAPQWFLDKLPRGYALDGELWRERDGFEELSGLCQRADPRGWSTVNYFVFDAPDCDLPYEERLKAARQRCPDGELSPDQALQGKFGGRIATLPVTMCKSKTHLNEFMDDVLAQGGEGVILRRQNSPYERTRSSHSRKLKKWYDGEGVVVGYSPGTGRFKGMIGSIGLLMASGHIFTVGTGFPDAVRKGDYLPRKGSLVRYRCGGLTSDGIPRFPVYVGQIYDRSFPKDPDVPTTALRKQRRQEAADEQLARSLLLESLDGVKA
ncbi:unnamed protein product [Parajaminaea phylloscopi]